MAAKKDSTPAQVEQAEAPVEATVEASAPDTPDITKGQLRTVASELDISGRSSMDAPALAQAIVETVQPVATAPGGYGPDGLQSPEAAAEQMPPQPPAGELPPR